MRKEMCKSGKNERKEREGTLQRGQKGNFIPAKEIGTVKGKMVAHQTKRRRSENPGHRRLSGLGVLPRSPSPPRILVIVVAVTVVMMTGLPGDCPMPFLTTCAPATPSIALAVLAQAAVACAGSNNTTSRGLSSIMLTLCEEAANTLRGSRGPWVLRHHGRCIPP